LRQAAALRPDDQRAVLLRGDVLAALGRPREAVAALEQARRLARTPAEEASCWHRLAVERSKLGQYAEALDDYERDLAAGNREASVYANAAEILMALGRLAEAQDRYREAIRVDEDAGDRRLRAYSLALSYYGLGVALDRDDQPAAAREMIGRALALDPNLYRLQTAQQPGSDVFFLPPGDVHYYVGLASAVAGRRADAEAAFRAFIAHNPKSPWLRHAKAHLGVMAEPAGTAAVGRDVRGPRGGRGALRVASSATVHSNGPLPAPMIDAAWRRRPGLLDACLARQADRAERGPMRAALEIEIDSGGRVTRVAAFLPPALGDDIGRCFETAVKAGFVAPRPAHARATVARMELVLAPE
jgi:tetratricopeptide (TPR) repeat protein